MGICGIFEHKACIQSVNLIWCQSAIRYKTFVLNVVACSQQKRKRKKQILNKKN